MMEIQMVWTWLQTRVALARQDPEKGADIVQTAIIVGLFAAAAIVIVGILVSKATNAAKSVKTQ
jgi:hypothetical protein